MTASKSARSHHQAGVVKVDVGVDVAVTVKK
jgi:hypothetical protein